MFTVVPDIDKRSMAPDHDDDATGHSANETGSGVQQSTLSLDAILELLASAQRREILRALRDESDHTATVDELVAHVVDRETQRTGTRPGRDQIEMMFHHVHLSKLVDAGLVEYDARSQELRYWSHDQLEDLLSYISQWEPG